MIARHPRGTWYGCYRCFLPDLTEFTAFPLRETQLSILATPYPIRPLFCSLILLPVGIRPALNPCETKIYLLWRRERDSVYSRLPRVSSFRPGSPHFRLHPCSLTLTLFGVRTASNPRESERLLYGGERGIRTLGALLMHTRFPGVHLQPLGHLSWICFQILLAEREVRSTAVSLVTPPSDPALPSSASRRSDSF